jgi:predicted transcriptional regulator
VKGLIKQVGKKRHSFVYNLTEKGEKLAGDYEAWCLGL